MPCLSTALALCTSLSGPAYVVDGDTIRTDDGKYLRIIYMDTPEKSWWLAECTAEVMLGRLATAHLERLLTDGFTVEPTGTMGAWYRPEVDIRLPDGRTVAGAMVEDGYGMPALEKGQFDWCGDS